METRFIFIFSNSLTYIKPAIDNIDTYHQMLSSGEIDVFLLPTIPTSIREVRGIMSYPLGYLQMISILSGIGYKRSRIFNFLHCFEPRVWILLTLFYVMTSSLASVLKRSCSEFLYFYSILLNQSIKTIKGEMNKKYSFTLMGWLILTMFCFFCFHEELLSSILHEKPHVQIDSIDDMAQFALDGRLKQFYVLKGESCEDYINDRTDLLGKTLKPKMHVLNVDENEKDKWENDTFPELSTGEYVLVSDNSFLDYYYTTKLSVYPNIYRGKQDFLDSPYFLPLSRFVSYEVKLRFNRMYVHFHTLFYHLP